MKKRTVVGLISVLAGITISASLFKANFNENDEISLDTSFSYDLHAAVNRTDLITSSQSSLYHSTTSIDRLSVKTVAPPNYVSLSDFAITKNTQTSLLSYDSEDEAWGTLLTEDKFTELLDIYKYSNDLYATSPKYVALCYYDIDWDGARDLIYRVDYVNDSSKLYVFSIASDNTISLRYTFNCLTDGISGIYTYSNYTGFLSVDTFNSDVYTAYLYDFGTNNRIELGSVYAPVSVSSCYAELLDIVSVSIPLVNTKEWGMIECNLSVLKTNDTLRHFLWLSLQ